jgi:Protein of unknown function (DUF3892)
MVYITSVHMEGGTSHQHIAAVKWRNPSDGKTGASSRATMVDWIENKRGVARVRDAAGHDVGVGVVKADPRYLRSYEDGVWTDNLLAVERY